MQAPKSEHEYWVTHTISFCGGLYRGGGSLAFGLFPTFGGHGIGRAGVSVVAGRSLLSPPAARDCVSRACKDEWYDYGKCLGASNRRVFQMYQSFLIWWRAFKRSWNASW